MRLTRLSATSVALIAICAVGVVPRAVKVVEPNPDPGDDALAYYALATSLYEDGTFGGPDFNNASDWSPGAPLLYAGLFVATGEAREGSIRALQALMGLATVLVAFALGRRLGREVTGGPLDARRASRDGALSRLAGTDRADAIGLLGALGVAIYPPYIHATGETMSEPLGTLLLPATILASLWAYDRGGSPWAWGLPGGLAGLLALTRPEYLAVGVVLAVVAGLARSPRTLGRFAAVASVLLAAMAVPILPWTVHNLETLDRLVPISTGSGKALFVGTYLPGDGDYQRTKAILAERQLGLELEPGSEELDAVKPRPLFDTVAARYPDLPRDQALGRVGREQLDRYLSEQPLEYLAMTGRKVWRMWTRAQGALMDSPVGRATKLALLLAGLAGLALLLRRRSYLEASLTGLPILVITAVGAATLASERRSQILMVLVLALAPLLLGLALRRSPPYSEPP